MSHKRSHRQLQGDEWQVYALMLPAAILILIFSYLPMWGIILAFQNYRAGNPLFSLIGVDWVGLRWLKQFVESIYFGRILRNTIRLSLLNLVFGFTAPIAFALMLNEVRNLRYKKFVQTASYLAYFVSTVVVAGIVLSFVDMNGLLNNLLAFFGAQRVEWIVHPRYFPAIYTVTNVWKGFGFGSILYFSTISSIDPTMYEAARIDGANRAQQLWHITLPNLMFIIAVQLVMQVGSILNTNRDLILLLYRPSTYETADVIGTYVYRMGIEGGKYSYSTAVSLFMSLFGVTLTIVCNRISNKLTGYGLW